MKHEHTDVTAVTNPASSRAPAARRHGRRLALLVASVAGVCAGACASQPAPAGAPVAATREPAPSAPAPNMRALEAQVFAELNAARAHPAAYASNIAPFLPAFSGTLLRRPGWTVAVQTTEGAAAVREAMRILASQPAVAPLRLSEGLSRSARDLALDQSRSGRLGHVSSDGADPGARIERYGTWSGSYSENVDYGSVRSGRDVVEDMIIDDGVPSRGHRHNVFDPDARFVGVGCATHPRYGTVCVMDQAASFAPH